MHFFTTDTTKVNIGTFFYLHDLCIVTSKSVSFIRAELREKDKQTKNTQRDSTLFAVQDSKTIDNRKLIRPFSLFLLHYFVSLGSQSVSFRII